MIELGRVSEKTNGDILGMVLDSLLLLLLQWEA